MSSDEEGTRGGARGADDDVALPKATVNKLIQELLPPGFVASKEVKDLMAECCKEFVLAVSSEANEICDKESKKTMLPEHILAALKALGFEDFVDGVSDVLKDHKELAKDERKKKQSKKASGMSQEEMLRIQEELFAASKAKLEAGVSGSGAAAPSEAKEE
ncbi:uncharacterized protein JCM6883_003593 [Sporobolomyces salmoneus]|uniref:uncharacterized protein n=1 Tax=Sporobolomyces salmoneus TaxID=183962 RepID=UPI003182A3A8